IGAKKVESKSSDPFADVASSSFGGYNNNHSNNNNSSRPANSSAPQQEQKKKSANFNFDMAELLKAAEEEAANNPEEN
ncbi:MAG: hypothetical protein IJJ57_07355, partial [Ruminococcus sp.]|nr:hypothetical protein [Ruminococcus sp.]